MKEFSFDIGLFHGWDFFDFEGLMKIIEWFPNLEKCTLKHLLLRRDTPKFGFEIRSLQKLKSFEIEKSNFIFAKSFAKARLKALKVNGNYGINWKNDLWNFLSTQNELQSLSFNNIHSSSSSELFDSPVDLKFVPFKLTKLIMINFRFEKHKFLNLLKFMTLHVNTLMTIKIGTRFPDFIYKFVFAKLTRLKTLWLSLENLPDNVFNDLQLNSSVTSLTLVDLNTFFKEIDLKAAQEIFKRLPKVETLKLLLKFDQNIADTIKVHLKKLKSLSIVLLDGSDVVNLHFAGLESLNINFIESSDGKFSTTNLNQKCIETIAQNTSLQSLSFPGKAHEKFFRIIHRNCLILDELNCSRADVGVEYAKIHHFQSLRLRESDFFKNPKTFHEKDKNRSFLLQKDLLDECDLEFYDDEFVYANS